MHGILLLLREKLQTSHLVLTARIKKIYSEILQQKLFSKESLSCKPNKVKVVKSGISGTHGLLDVIIFWILEYYTDCES
jgi:hypothetical protein